MRSARDFTSDEPTGSRRHRYLECRINFQEKDKCRGHALVQGDNYGTLYVGGVHIDNLGETKLSLHMFYNAAAASTLDHKWTYFKDQGKALTDHYMFIDRLNYIKSPWPSWDRHLYALTGLADKSAQTVAKIIRFDVKAA
jgi:hypothetical protein